MTLTSLLLKNENKVFEIASEEEFLEQAITVFRYQCQYNELYKKWVELRGVQSEEVRELRQIPFLPISFFKTHEVVCAGDAVLDAVFTSSGTTGSVPSRHLVTNLKLYEQSFRKAFELFYGDPKQYCILALLPGYMGRAGSSLIYMVRELQRISGHPLGGFFLNDHEGLADRIAELKRTGTSVLLIGVSYALLDFCEKRPQLDDNFVVMETGGMKGTRREMLKPELHAALKEGLGVTTIHSEYGMTEMLSQAYSRGDARFEAPPWLRFMIRDVDDPLAYREDGRTGGLNVIDLANLYSCSFIATQDLARKCEDGKLELMGRFDHSDIRGCNLMVGGI